MIFSLTNCLICITNFLSKQESVLLRCQYAFSGAKFTHIRCSSVSSATALHQNRTCRRAPHASRQTRQPRPLYYKQKVYGIDRVYSHCLPQSSQNQLSKTHKKRQYETKDLLRKTVLLCISAIIETKQKNKAPLRERYFLT